MIILYNKEGRLGNKLLILAHAIAYSREHKEKLVVLNFNRYSSFFKIKNKQIYIVHYKLLCKLLLKCLIMVNNTFGKKYIDVYQCGWVHTEIESLKRGTKILVLIGEGFRTKNLQKHKNHIKQMFAPNTKILKKVNRIINSHCNFIKKGNNVVMDYICAKVIIKLGLMENITTQTMFI